MPEPASAPGPAPAGTPDDGDVVGWLLAGDPAIRWQTFRDLLDQPAEMVEAERALVSTTGWGRRLLDHQDPDGTWGGGLYSPKWISTTYTLLLLGRCGLDRAEPRAQRGVQLIWDGARYFDGGLAPAVSIDAPEACATSMYLSLAYYFGVDHPRVDPALDWLLANQLPDGGWNCRTVRFGDRHSSFHTSILALEALAEARRAHPDREDITTAMAGGREFFLQHRLYKSHRHGTVANPRSPSCRFLLGGTTTSSGASTTSPPPIPRTTTGTTTPSMSSANAAAATGPGPCRTSTAVRSGSTWNKPADPADGTHFERSASSGGVVASAVTGNVGDVHGRSGAAVARTQERTRAGAHMKRRGRRDRRSGRA